MTKGDLTYRAVRVEPLHEVYQHGTEKGGIMYVVTFLLGDGDLEREVFLAAKDELDAMLKFRKRWVFDG